MVKSTQPSKLPKPVFLKTANNGETSHICETCQLSFNTAGDLSLHKSTEMRLISCSQCASRFLTIKGMKQHFGKRHSAIRPYKCGSCPKKFKNVYALRIHKRQVHLHLARQQCRLCDKLLFNKYSMRRHLVICHQPITN